MIKFASDPVGIDDLSVYVPKLFLPTTGGFAASRSIDPAKLTKGIGIERMSIPDAHEDAATMGAMSMLDLMKRNDLLPDQIGKIYVGTESGVDEAKAIGTYIIGMLEKIYGAGSFEDCSTVELKSACIGATYALESLCNWAALNDENKAGIVIASDIARYSLNSPGEYTQGAGSVSLLVRKNPRLMAFDGFTGSFTRDEDDFFRPIGACTAVVHGKKSNDCYLTAVVRAFDSFKKKILRTGAIKPSDGECLTDHFAHILFHIPYPRMAEYASASIFRQEWRDLPRWKDVETKIGEEPLPDDFSETNEYLAKDAAFGKKFSKTEQFLDAYSSKVKESTTISRQVGNIYTGSLYLGLASLTELHRLVPGERICFCSYGSGCSAMVFSGVVQPDVESLPPGNILERLNGRTEINLKDYEMLHEKRRSDSIIAPTNEFAFAGIDEYEYRSYGFVN
ncbi:Hydroxymethylglutaryl-CoA synthase [uncultured archaeon]|nr:Hydroxymethylglutaryl-CoA synthase [uncultured archaeon]